MKNFDLRLTAVLLPTFIMFCFGSYVVCIKNSKTIVDHFCSDLKALGHARLVAIVS